MEQYTARFLKFENSVNSADFANIITGLTALAVQNITLRCVGSDVKKAPSGAFFTS